ncbi:MULTISPECIES: cytochrome P450 [Streptomyces]|uniref:cytochrome P450 n=1 Tax=Streptomyces TaxID=1883 RepID=UPI0006EBD156|nr:MULTISPECIES: cytochrome P450 [Streptomyces]
MSGTCPFPFPEHAGVEPAPEFATLPQRERLVPATLRSGVAALLVHRHEDVCQVLTDSSFARFPASQFGLSARSPESLALNSVDPPDHTRRRQIVAHAFTNQQANQLRPYVTELADTLATALRERGGPFDLLEDFAVPLTVGVIGRVFDLAETDVRRLLPLVERMMSTTAFAKSEVHEAHQAMFAEFQKFLAGPHRDPDGLFARIARATDAGDLGPDEAVHLAYGLLIAAHETTANQLGLCVLLLHRDPALAERLRTDPELLPAAVSEMLRYTSLNAAGGVPHVVQRPVRLGGADLEPGTVVLPVTDGANRDPEVFPEPDTLDVDRPANPHVALGHGRHRCLGAPLAQLELEVALGALLRALPGLTLAVPEEELEWRSGMYVRGVRKLPVTW